jgi:hypothetical protein
VRHEFQSQLEEVKARPELGRGTGNGASAAKPPKINGIASWTVPVTVEDRSAAQLLGVPGESHLHDHGLARPGHRCAAWNSERCHL